MTLLKETKNSNYALLISQVYHILYIFKYLISQVYHILYILHLISQISRNSNYTNFLNYCPWDAS